LLAYYACDYTLNCAKPKYAINAATIPSNTSTLCGTVVNHSKPTQTSTPTTTAKTILNKIFIENLSFNLVVEL